MADGQAPKIRAAYMRMMLDQLEKHPHPRAGAAIEELRDVAVEVRSGPAIGWLPGAVNFEVCEAMTRHLGRDGTEAYFVDLWPRVWAESPFMASFVQGILRMHRDPGAYLKYLRRGYPQVFKDFGAWTLEARGDGEASARLTGLPERSFVDDGAWLHYVAASLATLFEAGGNVGKARLAGMDHARREAQFQFSWER